MRRNGSRFIGDSEKYYAPLSVSFANEMLTEIDELKAIGAYIQTSVRISEARNSLKIQGFFDKVVEIVTFWLRGGAYS